MIPIPVFIITVSVLGGIIILLLILFWRKNKAQNAADSGGSISGFPIVSVEALDGFMICDEQGCIREWNNAMERMTGLTAEEVVGRQYSQIQARVFGDESSLHTAIQHRQLMIDSIEHGQFSLSNQPIEYILFHEDGSKHSVEEFLLPMLTIQGIAVLSIIRDTSLTEEGKTALSQPSLLDPVTGLYNENGFKLISEQRIKNAKHNKVFTMLVYASMDNLDWLIDTLGQAQGNNALKDATGLFYKTFRETDIIGRIDNNAFCVFISAPDNKFDEVVLNRLQQNIDWFNASFHREYFLTVTPVIAHNITDNSLTIEQLIENGRAECRQKRQMKEL